MFFRCGVGAGKNGYEIFITTSDSRLYGEVITISKNGSVIGSTSFDQSGEATYTVEETGTYTVSVTIDGTTYSETVQVAPYEVELTAGFTYERWLGLTDLDPDDYSSLAEVLADEEAVRQLMTRHASVDYLASFNDDDTSVIAVLNNDLAAEWISLTDYAMDVLEDAYGTLMASIGKYGYGEWALIGQVPKMTGASAPYGNAFASYEYSTNYAWKIFDGDDSTSWNTSSAGGQIGTTIGYQFASPTIVKRIAIKVPAGSYGACLKDFDFEGSNDGTIYTPLGSFTQQNNDGLQYFDINNNTAYTYYRIRTTSYTYRNSGTGTDYSIYSMQLYAWQPNGCVPIMTSNSTPYGEAIGTSVFSSSYAYYYAFDNVYSTRWLPTDNTANQYVGYKFSTPVCVKRAVVNLEKGSNPADITMNVIGSNDGTTWSNPIGTATTSAGQVVIDCESNDDFYLQYAITSPGKWAQGGTGYWAVRALQFYGRELTESVPKMDTNTTPYGEASGSTDQSSYQFYQAFDGNDSTYWHSLGFTTTPAYLQYTFTSPTVIKKVRIKPHYSSLGVFIKNYKIQGSNDGFVSDSHDLYTGLFQNVSTADEIIDINNTQAYLCYRLQIIDSYAVDGGNYYAAIKTLQLWGEDYSEKEWDTEHPRHYIYDHGLELETVELNTQATYASLEKAPYELILTQKTSATDNYTAGAVVTSDAIDLTDYDLMFCCVGDKWYNANSGSTHKGGIGATVSKGSSINVWSFAWANIDSASPLKTALDISNIDQSVYCVIFVQDYANSYVSLTELWLE